MTNRTWLSSLVLAVVIVASMALGGLLAVNVGGDDDADAVATASPAPDGGSTTLPAVASSTPEGTATERDAINAAIADLPGLVDQASPSVVQTVPPGVSGTQSTPSTKLRLKRVERSNNCSG